MDDPSIESIRCCLAIPTYQRGAALMNAVRDALAQDPPADEIFVIDQTPSHDAETEAFLHEAEIAHHLKRIRTREANLPAARNTALAETTCEIIIFIDDDVRLNPGFIEAHRQAYQDPELCAVAGRSIPHRHFPAGHIPADWPVIMDFAYRDLTGDQPARGIANFNGCNHSLRVQIARDLGGYDAAYSGWAYREDSDMAIRLWQAGHRIDYLPDACLEHLMTPSGGCRIQDASGKRSEVEIAFPELYFLRKHFHPGPVYSRGTLQAIRRYTLRKDNVLAPWRLVPACWAFLQAVRLAKRTLDQGTPSAASSD